MAITETYVVISEFEVAGKRNGDTITNEELLAYDPRVNIDALLQGCHLSVADPGPQAKPGPKKAGG